MPKHVVIGGLGNLGRHIQRVLLENGRHVRVLDHPSKSAEGSSLLEHKSVEFVPFRLGTDDSEHLTDALKDAETVYSLVTPDVQHGTVREFEQTNHIGLQHLIASCRQAGVAKLVYASSLAVTNHFIASKNATEAASLPPMDTYVTAYDRTKRLGEDLVLSASSPDKLQTCALRLGAVLASPTDYMMRRSFESGPATEKVYTVHSQPIDAIAAHDVARAMLLADNKLSHSDSQVAGRALFVTKCRSDKAPRPNEVAAYLADRCHWQLQTLPPYLIAALQMGLSLQYKYLTVPFTRDSGDLPGMPPHLYLSISNFEKTFDNTLARSLLGFQPDLTWQEAVDHIVDEFERGKR